MDNTIKLFKLADVFEKSLKKHAAVDVIEDIRNFMEYKFPTNVWETYMENNPPTEGGKVGGNFVFEIAPGNVVKVTGDVYGTGNLNAWAKKAFQAFGGLNKLKQLFTVWSQQHNTEAPFRDVAKTETSFDF